MTLGKVAAFAAIAAIYGNTLLHVPLIEQLQNCYVFLSSGLGMLVLAAAALSLMISKLPAKSVPKIQVHLSPQDAVRSGDLMEPPADAVRGMPSYGDAVLCWDPGTLDFLGSVDETKDVGGAIAKAREAQKQWSNSSFERRRHLMRILLRATVEHHDDIVHACCRDSGKTPIGASFGEVLVTCEKLQWMIDNGESVLAPSPRPAARLMLHKKAWVEYKPLGVIGVIAPMNYPFHNVLNHVISGLFAGNAVVIKVSEHTSWSGLYALRFIREALVASGESPDLVQMVFGFARVGQELVMGCDKMIFTGSTTVGKLVAKAASSTLTPCVLELGGKDPFVVCKDANMQMVWNMLMRAVYQNCGQNCIGVERVYVERIVYEAFLAKAKELVSGLRQGAPLSQSSCDIGATTMSQQLEKIVSLVEEAKRDGARIVTGGSVDHSAGDGYFFEPTVVADVHHGMRICKDELFGPVMCVIPFDDDDDLVMMLNDCEFGLCSSVFSGDEKRAARIASQINAGMCNINDYGVNYLIQGLPFGGVKFSGYGKFGGPEGLRELTNIRSCTANKIPGLGTGSVLPPLLNYPVSVHATAFASGLAEMYYAHSLPMSLRGIFQLLSALLKSLRSKN
eukprot:g4335.t1